MKEGRKTALLWCMAAVVLVLCIMASIFALPPPFPTYVQPSDEIASSWDEAKIDLQNRGKLDVNTATKEQLMTLPGMTSYIADDLLDLRDSLEGKQFLSLEQWLRVKNVTSDLLETWKERAFCG